MFYKKGGGDIWLILTLNNVFFLGKMEKTRVAEGGFTYSHNIISIYHPKWWFFGEDQKCSWGPKMKNKPNFFFDNRGFPNWGGGGGPPLGNFSHIIPFFSLITTLSFQSDDIWKDFLTTTWKKRGQVSVQLWKILLFHVVIIDQRNGIRWFS